MIQTSISRFLFLSHPSSPCNIEPLNGGAFLMRGEGCKGYRRTTPQSSRNSAKNLGAWLQLVAEASYGDTGVSRVCSPGTLLEESARSDVGMKVIHRTRWRGQGNHERLRVVADIFKVLRGQRQFFLRQIGHGVGDCCWRE